MLGEASVCLVEAHEPVVAPELVVVDRAPWTSMNRADRSVLAQTVMVDNPSLLAVVAWTGR